MSNRALRKLQGNSDILVPVAQEEESGDEDNVELPSVGKKKGNKRKTRTPAATNPFDLLLEDNGEIDDDLAKGNCEEEIVSQTENCESKITEEVKTRSKKKRKKKKKSRADAVNGTDDVNVVEEDEIDVGIRQVNELLGHAGIRPTDNIEPETLITSDMRALLTVEHKNLNPDNEMRRIFGARVVQSEQVNRRRNRHRPLHRSSWLTTPKDTWPPMGKTGLTMSHVESRHGNHYFTFKHNHQYQQIQFQFWDAVDSLNHQNIVNILQTQSYHIDSLLQLSEVCRMSEDFQMATELVERALYNFECAFHPVFSLTQGTCRLDYRHPENRAFFIALYRHLNFVGQKGCYRTSLEFCKLLLSLDPEDDPVCVLLLIDFYALRSQQYAFLIRMHHEWEAHRNLSQLPNFAFAIPLAMYLMSVQNGQETDSAAKMLQDSLLMFPGVLLPLLEKCAVTPDSAVTNSSFFGPSSQYCEPEALKQLIALYVGRCFPCWKEPEIMTWLEENVRQVLELVENNDARVSEYNNRRKTRYRGTPRNVCRHILISEIKEAIGTLPVDLSSGAVFSYDPLPPTDSINSYERPKRQTRAQEHGNYLSMFLQSLLPNFNPDEVAQEEIAGAVGGEQGNNLRQGIGALMDAMRDLLNNIRPVEPPVENQHNADGEGDIDREEEEWQ